MAFPEVTNKKVLCQEFSQLAEYAAHDLLELPCTAQAPCNTCMPVIFRLKADCLSCRSCINRHACSVFRKGGRCISCIPAMHT